MLPQRPSVCASALYARFLDGRLKRRPVTVAMAARLGANLVERIERLDLSEIAGRQWENQRKAFEKKDRDRDESRDMAQIAATLRDVFEHLHSKSRLAIMGMPQYKVHALVHRNVSHDKVKHEERELVVMGACLFLEREYIVKSLLFRI